MAVENPRGPVSLRGAPSGDGATASWLPLIVVVLAQILMSFNISALPVSVGPISKDLGASAISVATALVIYSLFVAAFVMPGAKLAGLLGGRRAFQLAVIAHASAMVMMAFSIHTGRMYLAQALAGLAAAVLVPTLVVLIVANYRGRQQAQALGVLAGVPAIAGALAFIVAGILGTVSSWRYSFGLLVFLAAAITILSTRLGPVGRQPSVKFDVVGAGLAAAAIALISFGVNNLNPWGVVLAKPGAPVNLLGLSPAPFMVAAGIVVAQAFFVWSRRRVAAGRPPLLSLEVMDSPNQRASLYSLLVIGTLGPAVSFLIPLYIQVVQDRSTMFTAVAVVPYTLAVAAAAILVVRLYDRLEPRRIGVAAFILVALGLILLAFTIRNEWRTPAVILGLVITGLGEGALLTLMFNLLVALSPKSLAGEVGALRGVANNLSTALGTAFVGVVAVGVLSVMVMSSLNRSDIPEELRGQVDLDRIDFVTNTHLETVLGNTTATPEEADKAVRINETARLQSLKASFLILAGVALMAIFPACGLPRIVPPAMRGAA